MNSPLAFGLALVFDMDGVVIDSNPVHGQAWAIFSSRFGVEATAAMQERTFGKHNNDIVRDLFGPGLPADEVLARGAGKEALYRQMISGRVETMLVPGLRTFLDTHRGSPMALASNAEPENIEFLLERAGLRPYFRVVLGGHQVRHPKPHPEIYLRAAERLGVAPANCIVFEDSYAGIAAARAAGTRVIGLRTTHENLPETDLAIDDFLSGDLNAWLEAQTVAG